MISDEALNAILIDMKNQMARWFKKYNSLKTKHGKLLFQLTIDLNGATFILFGQHELTLQGIQCVIEEIVPTFNVMRIQNTLGRLKFIQPSDLQRYIRHVKCIFGILETMHNCLKNRRSY